MGVVFGFIQVWDIGVFVFESQPCGLVLVGAFLKEEVVLMQRPLSWKDIHTCGGRSVDRGCWGVCRLAECGGVDLHGAVSMAKWKTIDAAGLFARLSLGDTRVAFFVSEI